MRRVQVLVSLCAFAALTTAVTFTQTRTTPAPVVYEGARLILGTEAPAIENGAFVVQNGRISAIGPRASVQVPAGATRVDLTGKTVMPALVNIHAHIGYEKWITAAGESRPENHTPENIHDHLQREAYYGVGTVHDAGSVALDIGQEYLFGRAARKFSQDASRFTMMGGVVPINGGPDHILIKATRPLRASYEVTLAGEARAAVQMINAKGVKHIKVWLGDRRGEYPAMPHETYDAVIDESRKVGITVHAHATSNRDQIDALRAGVNLLVHTVQAEPVSDELLALVRDKKPFYTTVFGLGDRSELCDPNPFAEQLHPERVIADVRKNNCATPANAATREATLKSNFMAFMKAGAQLVLGTDAGVFPRYSFGWADHHEMARYVELGLTPNQAIIASTSRPAATIGHKDVGQLATGFVADFLVLNANPLENISNTRNISAVYLNGTRLDRDAMLDRWKQANAADVAK